jgi:DNA-binding transcriptional ArsR family regulator
MTENITADILLGRSKTRRRILALLLDRPERRLHLRAIARSAGTSAGTASRELRQLEGAGLVIRSREGAQVYHQANAGSALLEPVRTLLREAPVPPIPARADPVGLGIARSLASSLPGVYPGRLRGVFLYGSRARGDHRPDSDVDILIVLDQIADYGTDLRRSSALASELSLDHDVTVTRLLVPEAAWTTRDRPIILSAARDAIRA